MEKFVQIERVGQTFDTKKGKFIALRDVNLDIREGEFVTLIGHSGCGKSTLLNLIAGLTKPTSASAASVRAMSCALLSVLPNTRSTARCTLSKQVSQGSSEWFWNTTARSGPGPLISLLAHSKVPAVGVVSPAIRFSSVDLPQPECPMSATNSPLATVRLMSRSAGNRPLAVLKVCSTPWISMNLVLMEGCADAVALVFMLSPLQK